MAINKQKQSVTSEAVFPRGAVICSLIQLIKYLAVRGALFELCVCFFMSPSNINVGRLMQTQIMVYNCSKHSSIRGGLFALVFIWIFT